MFFDLRNRRDDAEKNRLIASLRVSPGGGAGGADPRRGREYRAEMAEFGARFMGPPGDVLFRCGAGHGLCVDAYGRAQPCMGVRAPELTVDVLGAASARADALERFERLRELRATNPEYLRRCARLLPQGPLRAVPGQVVGRARHAGYPGGVPLRGRARAGALPGLARSRTKRDGRSPIGRIEVPGRPGRASMRE